MDVVGLSGPFFDPPYDSPIEELFAINAIKYFAEDARLEKQVEVPTFAGTFRLDLVAERAGRRLAVECDGRDFHDEYRDEWRDALILGNEVVDVLYRLRGSDLTYHIEDLLFLMSQADPDFFGDRGKQNLTRLASDEARAFAGDDLSPGRIVPYRPRTDEPHRGIRYIYIRRWPQLVPPSRRALWWDWWRHARRYRQHCQNVDEMMAAHAAWLNDLEAGAITGDEACEQCGMKMERWATKAVWHGKIVCRGCHLQLSDGA